MFSTRTGVSTTSAALRATLSLLRLGVCNQCLLFRPCLSDSVSMCSLSVSVHVPDVRGGARYAEMDERPFCKKCFEKIPVELRRRLKKQVD